MNEANDLINNDFTSEAAHKSLRSAILLGVTIVIIAAPLFWWKAGWQAALQFTACAAISLSGIWEWKRLMALVLARLEASDAATAAGAAPTTAVPMRAGSVVAGFFLRLIIAGAVLYGSLKYLEGSVAAVVTGLAVGASALIIEALRLVKRWTE